VVCAAAVLVVAWPVYVFAGSQVAYALAVGAACTAMVVLVLQRSVHAVTLLVAEVALLGTEASGELAPGTQLLGSLRILDVTLLAGIVALAASGLARNGPDGWRHWSRRLLVALRRPIVALTAAVLIWAVLLWILNGAPRGSLLRTDLRLLWVGGATGLVGLLCRPRRPGELIDAITWVGAATSVKAIALWASGLWAIGTFDRIQAIANEASDRVILVGGDTVLILTPAIALLALHGASNWQRRVGASAVIALAFCAILLSKSRTSILVAAVLALAVWGLRYSKGLSRARRTRAIAAFLVVLVLGAVVSGTAGRFTAGDAPHTGVFFRIDEARAFFHQPVQDLVVGQGLAGAFLGKDINGKQVVTGWVHTAPLWLLLKVGVFGLVAACAVFALLLMRAVRTMRTNDPIAVGHAGLAVVIVSGLLAMSFSLDRIALPEGVALLGVAAALVAAPPGSRQLE
jgi:hypothetical protein